MVQKNTQTPSTISSMAPRDTNTYKNETHTQSDGNTMDSISDQAKPVAQPAKNDAIQGNEHHQMDLDKEPIRFRDWGFKLDRLFEVAYRFYKRNESKAFHPTFDERNHMNALILQARYGNFDNGRTHDVGVLDLVGKRRQYEWSLLKGMSKTEAMSKFICLMDELCPFFKAHAEAVKISSGIGLSSEIEVNQTNQNGEKPIKSKQSLHESSEQLRAIHSSLCRQTHNQFKSYAEKQFPNDIGRQKDLITTLQDQYYQQYISQMHPELKADNQPASSLESAQSSNTIPSSMPSLTASESSSLDKNAILNLNSDNNNSQGEQDVQADISSEELNATDEVTNVFSISQQPSSQSISDEHLVQLESSNVVDQQNHVEPVKLYQNVDLPIGPFESYPEPKPITKPQQSQSSKLDTIDPNPPRNTLQRDVSTSQTNNSTYSPNVTATNGIKTPDSIDNQDLNEQRQSQHLDGLTKEEDDVRVCECNQVDEEDDEEASASKELWNYSPPPQPLVPEQPLEAATIWSKRGVSEFKLSLADDKQGGVYEVKQSSLVCIQVPTYRDGKYIYFEFATDDYDIGFGLDFVYEMNLSEPLAINIYEESEDEDDDDDDELDRADEAQIVPRDIESGHTDGSDVTGPLLSKVRQQERVAKMRKLANTIQIIPTYRRDSHEEVFVGRHRYPGTGYYLLKFDNTYSVLRSKSLYFRICYFV